MAENITNTYDLVEKFTKEINYNNLNLTHKNTVTFHVNSDFNNHFTEDLVKISSITSDTKASTLILFIDGEAHPFANVLHNMFNKVIDNFCQKSNNNKVIFIYNTNVDKSFIVYTDNHKNYYSFYDINFPSYYDADTSNMSDKKIRQVGISFSSEDEKNDDFKSIFVIFTMDPQNSDLSSFSFESRDGTEENYYFEKYNNYDKYLSTEEFSSANDYHIVLNGIESVSSQAEGLY